ncbi:MAG TPA: hypothetical protein VI731_08615 [Bacteroidia bacterium]|nr:hypothetical protein [Bacteroidia bacterium]
MIRMLIAFLFFALNGYAQKPFGTIAFWNVENLFDTIDDPAINDAEFLPGGKNKWTAERYKTKLNRLSKVILAMNTGRGPDLLGLAEVENYQVLCDLTTCMPLKRKKYGIVHYDSPDRRGIDVALIYKKDRFTVLGSKPISLSTSKDTFYTRDILLVKGVLRGKDTLYIFVNHWPSRRGGQAASEPKRMLAARVLRKAQDSILRMNPRAQMLAMGDFNDEPTDKSVRLLHEAEDIPGGFINLMDSLKAAGDGSYHYRKEKNMLDQILVTRSLLDQRHLYVSRKPSIVKFDWTTGQNYKNDDPGPLHTYAGSFYIGGYSDHYPVMVTIYFAP